jgi:hypothetical protein
MLIAAILKRQRLEQTQGLAKKDQVKPEQQAAESYSASISSADAKQSTVWLQKHSQLDGE